MGTELLWITCCRAGKWTRERVGCMGLSIGGFRAAHLAGLDSRIKAAVVAGWMTTYDSLLKDHLRAHTWMIYVPGQLPFLDLPDVASLNAPNPLLIANCSQDVLFPLLGNADRRSPVASRLCEVASARSIRVPLLRPCRTASRSPCRTTPSTGSSGGSSLSRNGSEYGPERLVPQSHCRFRYLTAQLDSVKFSQTRPSPRQSDGLPESRAAVTETDATNRLGMSSFLTLCRLRKVFSTNPTA